MECSDGSQREDPLQAAEREALLRGLPPPSQSTGDGSHARSEEWQAVNFRAETRRLGRQERTRLTQLSRRIAELAADELSSLLRATLSVSPANGHARDYEEFARGLPLPANLYAVQVNDCPVPLLIQLTPGLLRAMVDRLLGNEAPAGDPSDSDLNRQLTPLEEAVATSIVRRLLQALRGAWPAPASPSLKVVEHESNPFLLDVGLGTQSLRITTLHTVFQGVEGEIQIALPQTLLLDLLAAPLPPSPPSPAQRASLIQRLATIEVPLSAELTTRAFLLNSLLSMQPGDTLDTGLGKGARARILIGGQPVSLGTVGIRDGKVSIRLEP